MPSLVHLGLLFPYVYMFVTVHGLRNLQDSVLDVVDCTHTDPASPFSCVPIPELPSKDALHREVQNITAHYHKGYCPTKGRYSDMGCGLEVSPCTCYWGALQTCDRPSFTHLRTLAMVGAHVNRAEWEASFLGHCRLNVLFMALLAEELLFLALCCYCVCQGKAPCCSG